MGRQLGILDKRAFGGILVRHRSVTPGVRLRVRRSPWRPEVVGEASAGWQAAVACLEHTNALKTAVHLGRAITHPLDFTNKSITFSDDVRTR